jgi:hypothetical protein
MGSTASAAIRQIDLAVMILGSGFVMLAASEVQGLSSWLKAHAQPQAHIDGLTFH